MSSTQDTTAHPFKFLLHASIRINSILTAILFAALGNSILMILLPINLKQDGISLSYIGGIMAGYSIGVFLGSQYGNRFISRVGHNRTYACVASIIACAACLHIFFSSPWLVFLLRVLVGFSMAVVYITLESWLNATSERHSRASIYALYQICFALGMVSAPFLVAVVDPLASISFGLAALFLSFSLIPLSLSRFPTPEIRGSQEKMSIIEMLRDSPSGVFTTFISGLAISALLNFSSIYAVWLGLDKLQMAILIAAATGSSILFQIPIGRLADKLDIRRIILAISILVFGFSLWVYYLSQIQLQVWTILFAVFMVGGLISCLYPLGMNFIFNNIDTDKAVPAMSTILIIHSLGLILGPITCSLLMQYFDPSALFLFVLILMGLTLIFMTYRVAKSRKQSKDTENIPYVITIEMINPSNSGLDPRINYLLKRIDNPVIQTIANAIALSPNKSKKIIQTNIQSLDFSAEEIIQSLIMLKPRRAKEITGAMVSLYPEKRIDFVYALRDFISLNKSMINHLIFAGLSHKADDELCKQIEQLMQEFIDSYQKELHPEDKKTTTDPAIQS